MKKQKQKTDNKKQDVEMFVLKKGNYRRHPQADRIKLKSKELRG